jgi:carbon monoxide dehydrogenase subunit G
MIITSDTVTIKKPAKDVFNFLADLNNLEKIMPEQVEKWTSTENECHFTVKGMASLGLKVIERVPYTKIALTRNGNAPFEYTITCHVEENGLNSSVRMVFESDMNMMMKMMAERPLTNFVNMLVHNLEKL